MVGANNLTCVHTACTGKHICSLQLNMVKITCSLLGLIYYSGHAVTTQVVYIATTSTTTHGKCGVRSVCIRTR